MPATRSPAQQAAARANGARSRGPVTEAGKARSASNGTRHGLRGGPFALLPGEDREEFAELHAAVTADWGPRDAYERRWVMELVTSMWRQDRLRGLELATLDRGCGGEPAFRGDGAQAHHLRPLRRPDRQGHRPCAPGPARSAQPPRRVDRRAVRRHVRTRRIRTTEQYCSNEVPPRTREPEARGPHEARCAIDLAACTREPEPPPTPSASEPAPALNRHQRRRLDALARRALNRAA